MKWIGKLFSEDPEVSSMRFAMVVSLFFAFIIAETALFLSKEILSSAGLCGVFITPVFAKAYQKKIEVKQEPKG